MKRPVPEREQGAALLTVLLFVAFVGAIAAAGLERLRLSTRLATNVTALDQARMSALGVESLVALIVDDLVAWSPRKTLGGDWNGGERRIELPGGGVARATLRDGGNCFNINSVADGKHPMTLVARPEGIRQFQSLMRLMDVPEASARTIAESAADWVDAGAIPLPAGAEDAHYAQGEQGYRTGNTYFHDVSELRTVQGMTPDIYKRLRPWICALPVAGPSPINFNTLTPEQAPLVAMLAPERISLQVAAQAISERPPSGWESGPQFFLTPALKGVSAPLEAELQPQAATQWFSLDVTVEVNGAELEETALFDARTKPVKLVSRRWGESE